MDKGSCFIFMFIKTKETISIQSVIDGVVFGNCVGRFEILLGSPENRGRGEGVGECDILPTLKEVWRIDVTDYFCSGIAVLKVCASVLD